MPNLRLTRRDDAGVRLDKRAGQHTGIDGRDGDRPNATAVPVPELAELRANAAHLTVVKRKSYFSSALVTIVVLVLAACVWGLAHNPHLAWSVVGNYLFNPEILIGVRTTIYLSLLSMVLGIVLGVFVGLARMSSNKALSGLANAYIMLFRGVPVLVQLLVWGNIGLLLQNVTIGIPFTDVTLVSVPTNGLVGPFIAAVLGLTLAEAAYMAEVVRGGILGVDQGQVEAAAAIGMTPRRTMRRIVLPQALRLIIPPTGNEFVNLIKGTSLVAVIAGGDVLTQAQNISATSYRILEMLAVATVWYLVLVAVATIGQAFLERSISKGST